MKNIKGILSIIILLISIDLMSQDISIISEDACIDTYTGSIDIDFDQYVEDYTLPFTGSYYNLTTGDYEEITITSNPLILNDLAAGEYEFQIFISSDEIMEFCWEVYEYTISEEIEIETFNADCYDDNGRIVISTSSTLMNTGTPITATVLNLAGDQITQKNILVGLTQIKDLMGGNYYLKIELQNGCEELIPFTIANNPIGIPFEVIAMNKACLADGGIDIYIDPAIGSYTVEWQNIDTKEMYNTEDLQNVISGTYCLSIKKTMSKYDCQYTDTCLVVESSLEFGKKIVKHVCDSTATNGSILLEEIHDNYSYKWDTDPPKTGPFIKNLEAGKYCVVVTDEDDCEHHECFTVELLSDSIVVSYDIVDVCPDGQGGKIILNVEPFTDNTHIFWDDLPGGDQRLFERNNLMAGDYMITVTNECASSQQNINIEYDCTCPDWLADIPPYTLKFDCEDASADGYIFFDNVAGFSFLWPNGSTDYQMSGLSSGTYEVILTHDESQCQKIISFDIEEAPPAEVDYAVLEKACPSGGNGEVEVFLSGTFNSFYWYDLGVGSNMTHRTDLDPGTYKLVVQDACGQSVDIEIPEFNFSIQADNFTGCDPFDEVTFEVIGDNPPFVISWETGDTGALSNVEPGSYAYTITDSRGCEYEGEYEIADPIEVLSFVKACPDVSNGNITFQINNPNNEYLTVTYDFGPCGECEDFPLIDPTYDSILVISLDNLPGGVPFTFEIDFGGCHLTKSFTIGEEMWEKEYVSSEEIDDIIYCTYDKVCRDIVIEGGFVEPADIDHSSHEEGSGSAWLGFGSCGKTNLVCGSDSVGFISGDPIKMRALEARVFYDKLNIVFDEFWEIEIDRNPCRDFWVCPNGYVTPSFGSGDVFGGEYVGEYVIDQEEGCHEIICEIDLGLFSLYDNFVICDSFEFLPGWLEPYVNDTGEESEEKCDEPYQVDAFSIINLYKIKPALFDDMEDTELFEFIEEYIDNPAQYCATITYCNDDFTVLDTDIDEIDCNYELVDSILITDNDGSTVYADPCEPYDFDDNNVYILCPTDCDPKEDGILGCFRINIVPFEAVPPGIVGPNGGPKSQSRKVAMQPQSESSSFYTFTQYITEYGHQIYKPLLMTDAGDVRLNLLIDNSYETFPMDNIVFAHEDFRDGYHYILSGKEGNYQLSSGTFSNVESRTLESSGYLNVLSNNFKDDYIFLSGEFVGALEWNNETILNNNLPTQFSLTLDEELNIIDMDYSEEAGVSVLHSNGKYLEIGVIGENNSALINVNSVIEIKQYYYDPQSNNEYLIVKGAGLLTSSTVNISLPNQSALSLICIQNDDFVWSKEIGEFNTFGDNIPITTDEDESIYLGISFKNQITLENLYFEESNENSFDIIIVKLSKSVELESYHLVSNTTDEVIEEMRIVNNAVTFGITSTGHEFSREVGEKTFFQFDNEDSRGITSYLNIDEMILFSSHRGVKEFRNELFRIIPNPASDRITISSAIQEVEMKQIQIFNINGKLVKTIDEIQSKSKNLDVSPLITGVYSVKVTFANQKYSTQKLIITK